MCERSNASPSFLELRGGVSLTQSKQQGPLSYKTGFGQWEARDLKVFFRGAGVPSSPLHYADRVLSAAHMLSQHEVAASDTSAESKGV